MTALLSQPPPTPVCDLRPARKDDRRAIRRLVRTARINPVGLDWRRFIVAVTPMDGVIGCGQIKPHRETNGSTCLELASIAVEPSWRGQGVASAIVKHLLTNHPSPIYLTCRASLGAFYQKFGFQPIPQAFMPAYFRQVSRWMSWLKNFHLVSEDLLVMWLKE